MLQILKIRRNRVLNSIAVLVLSLISACSMFQKRTYTDNYPEPCTLAWFNAIEAEAHLSHPASGLPRPGSTQWLNEIDNKHQIAARTNTIIGNIEWCHELHQKLIGL